MRATWYDSGLSVGLYTTIRPSTSSPYCFTVPTTPTMVIGVSGSCHSRLPTASPLGQKRCANFSSITATGCALLTASNSVTYRPLHQRNLHRPEVVGRGGALVDLQFLTWLRREALDVDAPPTDRRGERKRRHSAAHRHAGNCRRAFAEVAVERDRRLAVWQIARPVDPRRIEITLSGLKPGDTTLQADEAADQKSGADQQHQRERDLRDDQQAAKLPARRAEAAVALRVPAAGFERGVEVDTGRAQRRRQPENKAGGDAKSPKVNASTVPSMPMSSRRGMLPGLMVRTTYSCACGEQQAQPRRR